ncbi:MAG: DUF4190 domain-containing protein [Actinobacteria bacterium]|nr:MAG: DUF4190 domain-containing protein [Actinomycetota bacterium]
MTYPPRPGGWLDQPAGGWQEPAGPPVYLDPASGQPVTFPGLAPYSPPPDYAYLPYQAPVMVPSRRTNGMSIAAMVVSIVGLLSSPCWGVPGIAIGLVGAILGHVGYRQTKERDESGGGMAIAGIAIGWIAVLIGLVIIAIYVFFFLALRNAVNQYPYPTPTYS